MQTINPSTAQQLAEELVAKTQQIKALGAEVDILKLEIYDAAQGSIRCAGGRVVFVEPGTSLQLDRDLLKARLVQQFALSDVDAASFVDACKSERAKPAYISVYLD
jgi:hypothetical protein